MFPFSSILDGVRATLKLTAFSVIDSDITPGTATAIGGVGSNGNKTGDSDADEWIADDYAASSAFDASDYEAGYFSVSGDTGSLSGPAFDTYHGCDTGPVWSLFLGTPGALNCTGILRVRQKADTDNEVSALMTLSVFVDFEEP